MTDDEATVPDGISIESAVSDDRLDVLRVLDAAMLETDSELVTERIDAGDALVARFRRTGAVVGALVATRPDPRRLHVDAVAVRRARRGRGIGSALVAAAVRRAERDVAVDAVTAAFDSKLEAFYTDLGFQIDRNRCGGDRGVGESEADRVRGRRPVDAPMGDDDPESGERRR
ncbi:GNAT family N-acetyltransferase [Halorubrum sp. HHNYT27]|uniref:GNAT family N-acetyltransferase n=1 Tax=Halorubrum sp. HHNYT27 TaxID=3402275 RepID=UPI003EB74AF1